MKKLNEKYFTLAIYALGVIAFSLLFLLFCINFGLITSAVGSFLSAISSLLYAIFFAFLLFPAVKRFDALFEKLFCKKKAHPYLVSGFSITVTLLIALGLIAALLIVIIPRLLADAAALYQYVVQFLPKIEEFVAKHSVDHPLLGDIYTHLLSMFSGTDGTITILDSLLSSFSGILTGLIGQISNILLGLVIAIYLLASRRVISGIFGKLVVAIIPERHVNRVVVFFKGLYTNIASFSFNRFVSAILFALGAFLLCFLLRVPLSSVLVILLLIAHLIPVVGPILGDTLTIALVFILKGPWGFLYAAALLALEFFCTRILLSHMLPRKLRPSYAVTAIVVLVAFAFFGVIGAFVAVPLYASISTIFRRLLVHRLQKKKLPTNVADYERFTAEDYNAISQVSVAEENATADAEATAPEAPLEDPDA